MENNTQENKTAQKKKELGALWTRKSKQGNSFLSGSINLKDEENTQLKVVIFKNSYKQEGSSQPDYRIYLDESSVPSEQGNKTSSSPKSESSAKSIDDEIPF